MTNYKKELIQVAIPLEAINAASDLAKSMQERKRLLEIIDAHSFILVSPEDQSIKQTRARLRALGDGGEIKIASTLCHFCTRARWVLLGLSPLLAGVPTRTPFRVV